MQDVICTNTVIWLDSFWIVKKKNTKPNTNKNTNCESINLPYSKPLYSRSKISSLKSVCPTAHIQEICHNHCF